MIRRHSRKDREVSNRLSTAHEVLAVACPDPVARNHSQVHRPLVPHLVQLAKHLHDIDTTGAVDMLSRAAATLSHTGEYRESVVHARQAVRFAEEAGTESLSVAGAANKLAVFESKLGNFGEAERMLDIALRTTSSVLGPNHPEVGVVLTNLGLVQRNLGQLQVAETTLIRAHEIFDGDPNCGPDSVEAASVLGNLGPILEALGRPLEAEAALARALAIFRASLGADNPEIAVLLSSLGQLYHDRKWLTEADTALADALSVSEAAFGPNHPRVANVLDRLGLVEADSGRLRDSAKSLERALSINMTVYGPSNPKVAVTLSNLADTHRQLDDTSRAVDLLNQALDIFLDAYGPEHQRTLTVQRGLEQLA